MNHRLRRSLKQAAFQVYRFGTRFGIHILPVHYYSALPDVVELEQTRESWATRSEMPGIDAPLDDQVERMRAMCQPFQDEYAGNAVYRQAVEGGFGLGYGYIEAQALHGVVRSLKPEQIIEVGSGVSTACMLHALDLNRQQGQSGTLTCVEPYPSAYLQDESRVRLVESTVQQVPLDMFQKLGEGDLLFIDSSHTVKPGSDVNFLFLEVLPRLKPGVVVQVHDIYLPYDYQRSALTTFFYWMETAMLHAFLACNDQFEIVFCMSQLHYDRQDELKQMFPEYDPQDDTDGLEVVGRDGHSQDDKHFPASIYLRRR